MSQLLYIILLFDLHWCILFNIAIFIILTNVYTIISIYFYVCRWKVKKKKTMNTMNTTFLKITQVMELALAVTTVRAKIITMFGYQSKALYWLKYFSVKLDILFNVMDIVSQLKDKGITITVPFCMTKTVLYMCVCVCVCVL